jgi:hypothetical protein
MQDRFRFEMDHASYWQIQHMLRLPFEADSLLVTKLETLVEDERLWEFHKIFDFLDFDTHTLVRLLQLAHENSLFSGRVRKSVHARSGRRAQHLTEFDDETRARFREKFGDAAAKLGYED